MFKDTMPKRITHTDILSYTYRSKSFDYLPFATKTLQEQLNRKNVDYQKPIRRRREQAYCLILTGYKPQSGSGTVCLYGSFC